MQQARLERHVGVAAIRCQPGLSGPWCRPSTQPSRRHHTQFHATSAHADSPVQLRPGAPSVGELGFKQGFSEAYAISLKALGAGRYGVVYQAQHRASGKQVAVKVMTKEREDRSREEHLQSIQLEVALWRACQSCTSVVRLEGVYEDDRCVYMVQQLCTGGDLRSVLQAGLLTEREAAQVLRTVLNVVDHCHGLNHLYGDCKPHNFLLLRPHPVTGCQQFPPAPAADVAQAAKLNSSSQTIHEHVSVQLSASASSTTTSTDNLQGVAMPAFVANTPSIASIPQVNSIIPTPASFRAAMSPQSQPTTPASQQSEPTPLPQPLTTSSTPQEQSNWVELILSAQPAKPTQPPPANSPTTLLTTSEVSCGMQCHEQLVVLATDFGCCQPLHGPKQRANRGKRIGSPVYMAPEMWQANGHVGVGVDVWAAGVMLYQLLSGRYPFWSLSPEEIDQGGIELYQLVCGISSNPILFNGAPWDKVSKGCKDLIVMMLERQPHARITARQALRHPWMVQQLGCTPLPSYNHTGNRSGQAGEGSWEASMNN